MGGFSAPHSDLKHWEKGELSAPHNCLKPGYNQGVTVVPTVVYPRCDGSTHGGISRYIHREVYQEGYPRVYTGRVYQGGYPGVYNGGYIPQGVYIQGCTTVGIYLRVCTRVYMVGIYLRVYVPGCTWWVYTSGWCIPGCTGCIPPYMLPYYPRIPTIPPYMPPYTPWVYHHTPASQV